MDIDEVDKYYSPSWSPYGEKPRQKVVRWPRSTHTYKSYEEKLTGLSSEAVDHYNHNHKLHFELVDPVYLQFVRNCLDEKSSFYHLSFIARSKDSSRKLKFFFSEVCEGTVTICTPVEPGNPLFPPGDCLSCHPQGVIYHPFRGYRIGGKRYYTSRDNIYMTDREKSAKELLCERYDFDVKVQKLHPEEDKELRVFVDFYVQKALAWYGGIHERVFELSELVASVRFGDIKARTSVLDAVTWLHVTFKARDKDPLSNDASPDLFFAEINLDYNWVNRCTNMTQNGYDFSKPEADTSCDGCRDHCPMFHPKDGYSAGRHGGQFADALVKDGSWGTKVELLEKVGTSSNAACIAGD